MGLDDQAQWWCEGSAGDTGLSGSQLDWSPGGCTNYEPHEPMHDVGHLRQLGFVYPVRRRDQCLFADQPVHGRWRLSCLGDSRVSSSFWCVSRTPMASFEGHQGLLWFGSCAQGMVWWCFQHSAKDQLVQASFRWMCFHFTWWRWHCGHRWHPRWWFSHRRQAWEPSVWGSNGLVGTSLSMGQVGTWRVHLRWMSDQTDVRYVHPDWPKWILWEMDGRDSHWLRACEADEVQGHWSRDQSASRCTWNSGMAFLSMLSSLSSWCWFAAERSSVCHGLHAHDCEQVDQRSSPHSSASHISQLESALERVSSRCMGRCRQ